MKFVCKDERELQKVVDEVLKKISKMPKNSAVVLALYGNLGSGKTTFTKYFAKTIKVEETITSPTFVIQRNFKMDNENFFKRLYHFDLYRLKSEKELEILDWKKIIDNLENLIIIEWPNIAEKILPENLLEIEFTFIDEKTREIEILND